MKSLLPLATRRAIRQETLASFQRYAQMVFQLRPGLRSIAFCLRRGFCGIEHDFRYSCEETPAMEHRCGESSAWCSDCEGWDDFLPWTEWLKDWNERPGHAEAFLAYCADLTFTPYAVARRGARQGGLAHVLELWRSRCGFAKPPRESPPSIEVVATPLCPWFEPDEVIPLIASPSEASCPLFDAVYAAPSADAPKLALAQQLTLEADPRGPYITEQFAADKLDFGSDTLRKHRADWLGPLRLVADPASAAFSQGFPSALEVCFANHDAMAACANHRAWATVAQLEFLDPRKFPLREGVFIEDLQPITAAMQSLEILSGVRSRGICSLESLTTRLGSLWSLDATLESSDDLERLLRVQCLTELDSLSVELKFPLRPEADIWDRLWTRAPWQKILCRLTLRIDSHLELWSRTRGRLGIELNYVDSMGWFHFQATEAGVFSRARCHEWTRAFDRTIEVLARLPSLDLFQLEHAPNSPVSPEELETLTRELARIHPQAELQVTARTR